MLSVLILEAAVLALLLAGSAFFSATETALFSLSKLQLRRLRLESPRLGQLLSELLDRPQRLLSTILFGNTLVTITVSVLGYDMLQRLWPAHADVLSVPVMTLLVLVCGEVLPKATAIRRPEIFALRLAVPINTLERFTRAVRGGFEAVSGRIVARIEQMPYFSAVKTRSSAPTEDEYRTLLRVSERAGVVRKEERDMVNKILALEKMQVKEIMTPRVDMQCLEDSWTPEQMADTLRRTKHRRVPLIHDSPDTVEGLLNVKEFLINPQRDLVDVVELPNFIPETMSVAKLLKSFRKQEHPVAIVVDEYGGTQGMVTLEDILEEIVGEIEDEFDTRETLIQRLDAHHFLIAGKARLDLVNEQCGVALQAPDVETIAGWLIAQLGSLPKAGDEARSDNVRIIARKVAKNRVSEVLLEIGGG